MDRAACEKLDRECPLAHCRERFSLPEGMLYFNGNSLGALPKTAATDIDRVVQEEWGRGLVESWLDADWFFLSRKAGDAIAPLIGASEGEVVCADSTSVNLFKLAASLLRQNRGRRAVVTERGNFPTDVYILEGLVNLFDARGSISSWRSPRVSSARSTVTLRWSCSPTSIFERARPTTSRRSPRTATRTAFP